MDKQTSPDRFENLATKPPIEDNYLRVHIDVDLKLSPKKVGTAIWKTALNVGKQVVIWWLSGSMVVKTPHPDYPQLPVPPESIEQSQ
jgi:hypothetical protein